MIRQKIVAISPFASSESAGHPIVDDQFYFSYLIDRKWDFIYYTSEASARNIRKNHSRADQYLRIVEPYQPSGFGHFNFARQLKVPSGSKVIFFLYTESLVLTWLILNIFKPFSLFLVSSNNFSARRVRLYPLRFRIFFWAVGARLQGIVLDASYQVQLIRGLSERIAKRCILRKNHLMCPQRFVKKSKSGTRISIAYFGPDKPEKPLSTFIELINCDYNNHFDFYIYNVRKDLVLNYLKLNRLPRNVFVYSNWQNHSEYLENYAKADLVMLTHTRDFEGKLSGNLCDCVALSVPYIALSMEPVKSLHDQYGGLGYLCDFDSPSWAAELLAKIDHFSLSIMRENIEKMGEDYSVDMVRNSLDPIFEIDSN